MEWRGSSSFSPSLLLLARHTERQLQARLELTGPAEHVKTALRVNPLAFAPSHRTRDPSLHLNLTYPRYPTFLCAVHRLTSAHPSCLGCADPQLRRCRERQLLARSIQGSYNRPLAPQRAPGLTIPVLNIDVIIEVELEICLMTYS